jgi:hypothetical protein
MSLRNSRRGWPSDSYRRIAAILRSLGIDPESAFERLEWLGRPYDTSPKDAEDDFEHPPRKQQARRLRRRRRP